MIQRYEIPQGQGRSLEKHAEGRYVLYSDYVKLLEEKQDTELELIEAMSRYD
jgi:hypothetical protein